MEAFRQPHPDELDEKARHEQLFDVGYGWVVHCIRLSPPGAHEISVVYRPMRKVDDVGEEWKVGSVDEVHALMVELYAREFEDTVPDERQLAIPSQCWSR
jgi:hypothetical protein